MPHHKEVKAITTREKTARAMVSRAKRRKAFKLGETVRIPDLHAAVGLGGPSDKDYDAESDPKGLRNQRRQSYLDLKDDVFGIGGYVWAGKSRIRKA